MENGRNLRKLTDVSLGKAPADMVVKNGLLMDVYTGRMVPDRSVAIAGEWISYVGSDADYAIGPETHVIDAGGRVICPGYIDAHTHLVNYCDFFDFLSYAIPSGVTTAFTEIESYAFALGKEGIDIFLAQTESCPVKVYVAIPPMVSLSPATKPIRITKKQLSELLTHPRVLGWGNLTGKGHLNQ